MITNIILNLLRPHYQYVFCDLQIINNTYLHPSNKLKVKMKRFKSTILEQILL